MAEHRFVVCIANEGYEASLEMRKLYERLSDALAESLGQLRVIDESGEDYLFPASYFEAIEISELLQKKLLHAA